MPSLNTGNAILSNPIKVDSSYNVGIGGAASGSFKLQVTGTTNLTGALTGVASTFLGKLTIGNSSLAEGEIGIFETGGNYNFTTFKNGLVRTIIGSQSSTSQGFLGTASNHDLLLKTNDTTRLTIASTGAATFSSSVTALGNILIGTSTAPSAIGVNDLLVIGKSGSASNAINFSNGSTTNWGYILAESGKMVFGSGSSSNITFETNAGSERMRITSGGNVGIGTSSPNARLSLGTGTTSKLLVYDGGTIAQGGNGFFAGFAVDYPSGNDFGMFAHNNGALVFGKYTNNNDLNNVTERMRITSGGQIQIGGTTNTFIDFSGTTCRFWGGGSTNTFGLGAGNAIYYQGDSSQFYPTTDNARSIGLASNRYTAIWAVNGSIQTSDEREKKDIVNTDLGLDFVTKLRPVSFKWKVGQNIVTTETIIDEEGNETVKEVITPREGKRTHYGLIAQEVEALLDGKDFGGFISDEETGLKGLRYDQFVPLLIKSIQEQQAQIEAQQQQINSLINR